VAEEGEEWKEVAAAPQPGAAGKSNTVAPTTSGILDTCFSTWSNRRSCFNNLR